MPYTIISRTIQRFPYVGVTQWALLWSLAFIGSQLLWFCSRFVRRYDVLEIPMSILFFPLAPFFDPYDAMVNQRDIFAYALAYWVGLFVVALLLSRRRVHPAIPGTLVLLLTSAASIVYSVFFVYHGPIE